jgi:hypothetical protein
VRDAPEPWPINWRGVFDELGVSWVDRGPNCSRDNLNINCPACGDDNGFHMRVSEQAEIYNCWRDRTHGGRSFVYLLCQLGATRTDAVRLLNDYRGQSKPVVVQQPGVDYSKAWEAFSSLANAPAGHACLDYMAKRGFTDPYKLAAQFDLRYAKAGNWACRVLIPMPWGGSVNTWSGRAISPAMAVRYKVGGLKDEGAIYMPRVPRTLGYIVEGHLDALKIASAYQGTGVSAVAIGGKDLNPGRILRLQAVGCPEWRLMLDNDAPMHQGFSMLKDLVAHLRTCNVSRHRLPGPYKDAGEVLEKDIKDVLG